MIFIFGERQCMYNVLAIKESFVQNHDQLKENSIGNGTLNDFIGF